MNLLKKQTSFLLNNLKWLSVLAIIFAIFLTLILGTIFGVIVTYKDRFYPNTTIGNINVSNRTSQQAEEAIKKSISIISDNGIVLTSADNQINYKLTPFQTATDPDLAKTVFFIDADATIKKAWNEQHQQISLKRLLQLVYKTITGWHFTSESTVNQEEVVSILQTVFSTAVANSKASTINFNNQQSPLVIGQAGTEIDYELYVAKIIEQIKNIDNSTIIINTKPSPDPVTNDDLSAQLINNINYLASNTPSIIVTNNDKKIQLPFIAYRNWLTVVKNDQDEAVIKFDKILATPFWEKLKEQIDQPLQNARFSIANGRVKEFQASKDGQKVNIDKTLEIINQQLNQGKIEAFEAPIEIEKATVNNSDIYDLGISEIIGVGVSDFKGSPKNRRHNIAVGAKAITGILIPPGEEFSLIKTLGKIDGSTGYLQELVIKGNKTTPEYGGGLCQIGTTVFRATLKSGLPILERRNHSYRVSYYEPAGTDATIYDPKPDFRFKNDTNEHVLIQTRIVGDELFVEFWGTKDGRKIEQTKPTIYNIVQPGPAQMIETDTLKPGETKCIESPHAGADAFFDYKVTYPSGEEKSQRFTSHYVPWTKKCLVGKTETTSTSTATSSEPVLPPASTTPQLN